MDTIRIFVGTDSRMGKAETVLEHSIRKHASQPVEITWMRAGDPGWDDWNIGREPGNPYSHKGGAWATDFTCFRFAVPEAAGFQGRAIYLDADMFVRKDIAELYNYELKRPWMTVGPRTDVSVIDCSKFNNAWWPKIAEMKPSGQKIGHYVGLMTKHNFFQHGLPGKWDCLDGRGFDPNKICLVHFTNMRTQPWKPWPEVFKYPPKHPCQEVEREFWALYKEATAARDREGSVSS